MTAKVQIICTKPGMRRNGVAHPASEIYPVGRWSDDELEAFRADPAFVVREIADGENTQTADDFELRVENEVKRRLEAKQIELQTGFEAAVKDAARERVDAAEGKIAALQAKLDAAPVSAPDEGGAPKAKSRTANRD